MPEEWALWINRIGLLSDMLAFWFAAPELLGEESLRRMERLAEWGIVLGARVVQGILAMMSAILAIFAVLLDIGSLDPVIGSLGPTTRAIILIIGIGFALLGMISTYPIGKKARAKIIEQLRNITISILKRLADDSQIRQRSLIIGGCLFMLGFLLQLIATL